MTDIYKTDFIFLMKDCDGYTLKADFIGKKKEEILKEVFNPTSYPVTLVVKI